MVLWNVEFSYDVIVEADSMEQATDKGIEEFNKQERGDMNIEVSNYIHD